MLDLEQGIGNPGGFPTVAEVCRQYGQLLSLRQFRVAPEQAFYLTPGKEVRVHDLVRISAQKKVTGFLQCCKD